MTGRWGPPGGERTWQSALLLIIGSGLLAQGQLYCGRPTTTIIALLSVLAGIGLWFRRPWGRWLGVIALVALAGMILLVALRTGFTVVMVVQLVCLPLFALQIWSIRDPEPLQESPPSPMTSLVLLIKEPRPMEAVVLAKILTAAWGGEYRASDEAADLPGDGPTGDLISRTVFGRSPFFLCKSDAGFFVLHWVSKPYFDNADIAAEEVDDLRLKHAIRTHQAWISVDLMTPSDASRTRESYYREIGRLIAELSGEDCLALYHPETSRLLPWDSPMEDILRSPDPVAGLASTQVPVLNVDSADPRLQAAVEEARRRFPEFLEAHRAHAGDKFAIKAPVTRHGCTEFIWISYEGTESGILHGLLANDPVDLGGLKLGDRVEVPIADLNDWVFLREGEPVGLFSPAAIAAIRKDPGRA